MAAADERVKLKSVMASTVRQVGGSSGVDGVFEKGRDRRRNEIAAASALLSACAPPRSH